MTPKVGATFDPGHQYFYDTQVPGTSMFGPSFWENLRDGLTGMPYPRDYEVEVESILMVLPAGTPADILNALSKATVVVDLPGSSTMKVHPGPFRLSRDELTALSVRIEGADDVKVPVTITIVGHRPLTKDPQAAWTIPGSLVHRACPALKRYRDSFLLHDRH